MSEETIYKLKYDLQFEAGEFKRSEIEPLGLGAADALVIQSIVFNEKEEIGHTVWSCDGRDEGRALGVEDLFKMWLSFGNSLSHNTGLNSELRVFCTAALQAAMRLLESQATSKNGGIHILRPGE